MRTVRAYPINSLTQNDSPETIGHQTGPRRRNALQAGLEHTRTYQAGRLSLNWGSQTLIYYGAPESSRLFEKDRFSIPRRLVDSARALEPSRLFAKVRFSISFVCRIDCM